MEIIKKKLQLKGWTQALRGLVPEEDCLVADIEHKKTLRTMATRITQKEGLRFTFRTKGDKVNVWKLK